MSSSTNLLSGTVESEHEVGNGMRSFRLGGEAWANALASAVLANYNRVTGRNRPSALDLADKIGYPVTLIQFGENMFGSTLIQAQEGKLFASAGRTGLGILPKGARRKGFVVEPDKVLDVVDGYCTAAAQSLVDDVVAVYPKLRNLTQARLEELPGEGEENDEIVCSLAVFGQWRMPDGTAPDCVWLIGEYWPEDDICDRSVLLIRPQYGVSEHGSVYGRQLLNGQVGEIIGFEPLAYREAINLCDLDFDEACSRVFDHVKAAV
jgi:hypothetical protein